MRLGQEVGLLQALSEANAEQPARAERDLRLDPLVADAACAARWIEKAGETLHAVGLDGDRQQDDDGDGGREAAGEYLEIIDKEVDRCTRIVDGLLDFSRPKGKSKGSVMLNSVVEETLFLLKHHQRFKRLTLVRELDPTIPATLANPEQLTQVLMALMLNAVDAMDDRRGRLTVRTGRNPNQKDEVVVEIEDNGTGISRADQAKIFEPFYTTKPPGRGTGLGLSICYGIVEDHRGRIEVDSQPGRGSIFRVFLPVHQ
jgi:signal transduction histidine kinase